VDAPLCLLWEDAVQEAPESCLTLQLWLGVGDVPKNESCSTVRSCGTVAGLEELMLHFIEGRQMPNGIGALIKRVAKL